MKIKTYFMALLCAFIVNVYAEESRLYFDKDWHQTSQDSAVFYRPLPLKKEGDLYLIKDYYMSGKLQAEGYVNDPNSDKMFAGAATWYYENGQIATKRTYENGKIVGLEQIFYKDGQLKLEQTRPTGKATWYYPNGQQSIIRNYVDDKPSGEEITYFENGNERSKGTYSAEGKPFNGTFPSYEKNSPYQVFEYKDGKIVAYLSYYADSKTIAEYKEYSDGYETKEKRYYDRDGNLLSSAEYNTNSGSRELIIAGTEQIFSYDADNFVSKIIGQSTYSVNDEVISISTTLNELSEPLSGTYEKDNGYDGQIYDKTDGLVATYDKGYKEGEASCCYNTENIRVKGVYKNDYPYNGSIYEPYDKRIATYRNGVLEGKTTYYDKDFNELSVTNYINGYIDGKRTTVNPKTGEKFEADYSRGIPLNGSVYEYESLQTYRNERIIEKTTFDYNTGEKISKEIYSPDDGYSWLAKESYVNGKTYRIDYRDNRPYNGEYYNYGVLYTYKDGKLNGPYRKIDGYRSAASESGEYVNDKRQGMVTYQVGDDKFSATFVDDKPVSGSVYDFYSRSKVNYQDGKKSGKVTIKPYSQNFGYDTAIIEYINDIPVGKAEYFLGDQKVAEGQYKDGKPFDGDFYSEYKYEKFSQGQLLESEEIINKQTTKRWYSNGKLEREDISVENQTFSMTYQDGKPWQGEQISYQENLQLYRKQAIVSSYAEGKKNGIESIYEDEFFNRLVAENNYVDGKRSGNQYFYLQNGITFSSLYENGKPVEGNVIEKVSEEIYAVIDYSNGQARDIYYISGSYGAFVKTWVEGKYQNGEPYSGYFYNSLGSNFVFDYYEHGVKVKAFIQPRLSSYDMLNEQTAEGVITLGALRDEVRYAYRDYAIFSYDDNTKKSGKVELYSTYDELISTLYFADNKITNIENSSKFLTNYEYNYPFAYYSYSLSEDKQNLIIDGEDRTNLKIKIKIPNHFSEPAYLSLSGLSGVLAQTEMPQVEYYYQDQYVASYTLKDGYPYDGVFISPPYGGENQFIFAYYEKGQFTKDKRMPIADFIKQQQD